MLRSCKGCFSPEYFCSSWMLSFQQLPPLSCDLLLPLCKHFCQLLVTSAFKLTLVGFGFWCSLVKMLNQNRTTKKREKQWDEKMAHCLQESYCKTNNFEAFFVLAAQVLGKGVFHRSTFCSWMHSLAQPPQLSCNLLVPLCKHLDQLLFTSVLKLHLLGCDVQLSCYEKTNGREKGTRRKRKKKV